MTKRSALINFYIIYRRSVKAQHRKIANLQQVLFFDQALIANQLIYLLEAFYKAGTQRIIQSHSREKDHYGFNNNGITKMTCPKKLKYLNPDDILEVNEGSHNVEETTETIVKPTVSLLSKREKEKQSERIPWYALPNSNRVLAESDLDTHGCSSSCHSGDSKHPSRVSKNVVEESSSTKHTGHKIHPSRINKDGTFIKRNTDLSHVKGDISARWSPPTEKQKYNDNYNQTPHSSHDEKRKLW